MMIRITPDRINALRGCAMWVIRSVSIILIAVGAYLMLKRLALGIGTMDFGLAFRRWDDVEEMQSFYRGIGMVVVGAALGVLSRRIAAWVIAMPPTGCPQCGYAVAPPTGAAPPARCPECGLALDAGKGNS